MKHLRKFLLLTRNVFAFLVIIYVLKISVTFIGDFIADASSEGVRYITVKETVKDYQLSSAEGVSMLPTLPEENSPIIVFTEQEPQIGDMISFECLPEGSCWKHYTPDKTPQFITHRLISIKPDGCMEIRGDNVATRDPNEPCYYPDKDIKIEGVVYGLIK